MTVEPTDVSSAPKRVQASADLVCGVSLRYQVSGHLVADISLHPRYRAVLSPTSRLHPRYWTVPSPTFRPDPRYQDVPSEKNVSIPGKPRFYRPGGTAGAGSDARLLRAARALSAVVAMGRLSALIEDGFQPGSTADPGPAHSSPSIRRRITGRGSSPYCSSASWKRRSS